MFYQQLTDEERRIPFIFSNNFGTAKVKIVKNERNLLSLPVSC
jgi:hypothetical protein